ncbi:hypothetical protein CBR_g55012 [Chara braunii]|uniref:Uncharacterized protein n=1 Tax=Chara braunii TaxID=69332 RepID=A0A388K7K5_CHABU|nr:hypothetical protein CBR_g55012 [Chara braunii]|eukprot:GBG66034.1 hypothetical protein CBR_g55012 [Chara braunii]
MRLSRKRVQRNAASSTSSEPLMRAVARTNLTVTARSANRMESIIIVIITIAMGDVTVAAKERESVVMVMAVGVVLDRVVITYPDD